jgi:hypothetical protein
MEIKNKNQRRDTNGIEFRRKINYEETRLLSFTKTRKPRIMSSGPVIQRVSTCAITIVSDVAGCPHNFLSAECLPYAQLGGTVQHNDADKRLPATLVPAGAVVLSFVVDREGNTFVWKDGLFVARAEYCLDKHVGSDSIVYGFGFWDAELRVPVVRLFDACRLKGQCLLQLDCFQRFGRLFEGLSGESRSRTSLVRLHWVWTEGWLYENVMRKPQEKLHGLDCELQCAIRLPERLGPESCYYTILECAL